MLNQLSYPASTIKRIYKYVKMGYRADETFYQDLVRKIHLGQFSEDELYKVYID